MKVALIVTMILALLAVAVFVIAGGGGDDAAESNDISASDEQAAPEEEFQTFTTEQVALRGSADDCWMIIEASVYDLTDYVPLHSGGDEILRGCGRDATELFRNRRDNGETIGSGTPHSAQADNILSRYKIGELATGL